MEELRKEMNEVKLKIDFLTAKQDEIAKMMAENNVLLRKNLGLFNVNQTVFPMDTEDKLIKLENELQSDNRSSLVATMKRIIAGNINNITRIFGKKIIMDFNYDGIKEKKSLKKYGNILQALYEATKGEGNSYEDFVKDLRTIFKKVKNRTHKKNARTGNKEN